MVPVASCCIPAVSHSIPLPLHVYAFSFCFCCACFTVVERSLKINFSLSYRLAEAEPAASSSAAHTAYNMDDPFAVPSAHAVHTSVPQIQSSFADITISQNEPTSPAFAVHDHFKDDSSSSRSSNLHSSNNSSSYAPPPPLSPPSHPTPSSYINSFPSSAASDLTRFELSVSDPEKKGEGMYQYMTYKVNTNVSVATQ